MADDGLDVAALRAETPGCHNLIHFNNAGAGLMPRPVLETLSAHLTREASVGGYEAEALAHGELEKFYASAARLVGGKPHEIAYMENATRAWDMVFYAFDWKPGDRIVTARSEYVSNMISFRQVARKYGVAVDLVPDDESGAVDVAAMAQAITPRTRLIAVSHVPTNDGLVNPAAKIGALARQADLPFLLDACQSVGQMPVDAAAIGCTMLSATGRKYLRGPRGTGFLWVREDWIPRLEPPFLDLHSARWTGIDAYAVQPDARRFENWESYVAGRVGLGVAIDYALAWGIAPQWARIRALGAELRRCLASLPGVQVHDQGAEKCGIVTFSMAGQNITDLHQRLLQRRVNSSIATVQLTRSDLIKSGISDMLRVSVHAYNTEAEITGFMDTLAEVTGA